MHLLLCLLAVVGFRTSVSVKHALLAALANSHACCCSSFVLLQAVTHYNNAKVLADVSCNLGEPMVGIDVREKGFSSYANRSE
jgi:hypothetical protein